MTLRLTNKKQVEFLVIQAMQALISPTKARICDFTKGNGHFIVFFVAARGSQQTHKKKLI